MIAIHNSESKFLAMRWNFNDEAVHTMDYDNRAEAEGTVTLWTEELERDGSRILSPPTELHIPNPVWTWNGLARWWCNALRPLAQQVPLAPLPKHPDQDALDDFLVGVEPK